MNVFGLRSFWIPLTEPRLIEETILWWGVIAGIKTTASRPRPRHRGILCAYG
jgi:hypothetical protein